MGEKRKAIQKKQLRSIIIACLITIAIVSAGLALSTPGYIKRHINDYIVESSHGEYQLHFADIQANLYTQTVRFDSLQLVPMKTDQTHYRIVASHLKATGISVFDFLFHKRLKIKLLQIQHPTFEIFGQDGQKRDAVDKKTLFQRLKPFFDENLKSISIEKIRLDEARFDHFRLNEPAKSISSISDLNVGIENFRIDSSIINGQDKFFHADDIYVKIVDFRRSLGDRIHQLTAAELTYSIEKNRIYGKNLQLFPIDTSNHSSTLYWITIPEIKLSSQNLRNILGNDSVYIDSVQIINSNIRVKPGETVKKINFRELKKYDLYELIRHDFNLVRVSHLELQAGKLFFEPKTAELDNWQVFNEIKVNATNFQLDSADDQRLNQILYSDNFKLSVKSYALKLNDQVHIFEAKNIQVSSFDSLIRAEVIRLAPVNPEHGLPVTVQLDCDSLIIKQVDMPRLFHFREMPLNSLSVYTPKIIVNQQTDKEGNPVDEQSLLYHFIRDYIKGVYANLIDINGGHIEFNDFRNEADEGHISTDFDFRLTDFSLDSISARQTDKLFFATNLELLFKNYQMKFADQLHILNAKTIEVSTMKQLATVSQLHLSPDKNKNAEQTLRRLNRSELYNIRIPYLRLENTDIHHAFFGKKLNINKVSIKQPKIYLEVFAHDRNRDKKLDIHEFYDLLRDYITDIKIETFTAQDGDFNFVNHSKKGKTINLSNKFSLELEGFRLNEKELDSKRLLFSENFELKIKEHLFKLSDNVHFLKANEISFSSKSATGVIKNALLYPEISSEAYDQLPWHFQISIPRINLKDVNLEKAVFEETLDVGAVEIESPVIQFYKNKKGQDKFNFKDLDLPLPEELKELNLAKVRLKNGKLIVYKTLENNKEQLAKASIDFELEKANLKRPERIQTARFSAKSIETNIGDLKIWPGKIPYDIDVKKISFSSLGPTLDLTDLSIRNNGNDNRQVQSIFFPRLKFEQLDPTNAFDHNRFHASRLIVSNPVFNLLQKESEKKKNPLYIKLSADLNAIMDELSAEEIRIDDATLNLIGDKKTNKLDQIDIIMSEVKLDSTKSETPLGAKDLSIVRRNIQLTDKQKLYNILIDRFSYSTRDKNLLLNGLHIIPLYGPDKFQQLIDFQQDYYSGDIRQIKFGNIDLNRWFESKEFTGRNIGIDQFNLLIYRDKRKPFDYGKHMPMPQELLKSIDLPFYFDTMKLDNCNFVYNEQLEDLPEPGRASFEKLNARLYPFTNLKQTYSVHPKMQLNVSTLLMGEGELKAQLILDMLSGSNGFEARGTLSPFELTAMNPITENAASISIRSGQLNRFEFEFSGDSTVANGKLRFAYDDLKITLLAHKDGNTKEAKFLSFLANALMIKSKHPRTNILLPDDIHFYRDPNKSTLNYLWKSVFSGAKNTFGVKEDQE